MFTNGDFRCLKELLKPAKDVLDSGRNIRREEFEYRVSLWNKIRENYQKYRSGECGEFSRGMDTQVRAEFEYALLTLAWSFVENREGFEGIKRFNSLELAVFERIERYDVFEVSSVEDLKRKLARRDDRTLKLLEEYYVFMRNWMDEILDDPDIDKFVKYYANNRWKSFREKIDKAVSLLITEIDWFGDVIVAWKSKAKEIEVEKIKEEMMSEVEEKLRQIEEEKKKVEKARMEVEIARRKIEDKEREIRAKEEEIRRELEEVEREKAEIVRIKDEIERKERELKEAEEKVKRELEKLKFVKAVEKGSRYVTADEVKALKLTFIGRIEKKLGSEIRLFGKKFKVDVEVEDNGVKAKLEEKKLLGKGEELEFKAIFVSREERLRDLGIDTDPLTLEEVLPFVEREMRSDKRVVLCIASPTGFEQKVKEFVDGEEFHKNFLSKRLSLCLLDMGTGEIVFNRHDSTAKVFVNICEMELDEERIERVVKCILAKLESRGWIKLEDASDCGDKEIVKTAFYIIADKNGWVVKYIEDVGLVLMKR